MKIFWIISLVVMLFIAAFFLHVPVMKLVSKLGLPEDAQSYANPADGVVGEAFEIERIVFGMVPHVYFDPLTQTYLVAARMFEQPDPDNYAEWQLLTLDRRGHVLHSKGVRGEEIWAMAESARMIPVAKRADFPEDQGFGTGAAQALELVYYQKDEFSNWPELYYFVPVVYSDWSGVAFVKLHHAGEVFKLRFATDYTGGFFYSERRLDAQVYLAARDIETSGLGFMWVDESYYLSGMNGVDTHREGYGFYVIRPR